jgi:hypothetical protein
LEQLWAIELPPDGGTSASGKFEGIVNVLFEYLDMCVDWEGVVVPVDAGENDASVRDKDGGEQEGSSTAEGKGRQYLRSALEVVVAAAVRSGESKEVKKEVDKERSGIAMWRIP